MGSIRISRQGPTTVLELARPEVGNALGPELVADLTAALVERKEPSVRAIVLAASGKTFCTGANLSSLAGLAGAPLAARLADASNLAALYTAILRCPLATFAAVDGPAYGGGVGLAGACDFVIAGPGARFQFSEVRLGFVPALISVFLTRRLPSARLASLFLDPAPMDVAQAAAAGLVDEVAENPLERAVERAHELARKCAPSAIAETKRLLLAQSLPSLDQQLAHAAQVNAAQRSHPECQAGLAAFLERRTFPTWLQQG